MALQSLTGSLINPALLNPVFNPLLGLPSWLAIAVIALVMSLIVTLIYRFATDQELMKELKGEMKELQAEMKALKEHPEKMMEVQGRFMKTNMKYMMQSMRSTLFTIIPVIFIFGWLNASLAYQPLHPNVPFTVTALVAEGKTGMVSLAVIPETGLEILTGQPQEIVKDKVIWSLKGEAGEYVLDFITLDGKSEQVDVIVTEGSEYKRPLTQVKGNDVLKSITIGNEKLTPIDIEILGWKPGWLGTYIIFSIAFSMVLRRIMKLA